MQATETKVRAYVHGYPCYWDKEANQWRYEDIELLATGSASLPRRCEQCKMMCSYGAADPCLGMIPGAASACCGHGKHAGYVNWPGISAPDGWWQSAYLISADDKGD